MCSLFGLIDYSNALPAAARKVIIRELSRECEVRGTDATGISYNSFGKLKIFKRPVRASKLNIRVPFDSKVVMGHTRMTTKGNQRININNHPFPGHVEGVDFSLAHNGVLHNDELLRKTMKLPDTNIETDSYIAVQLIENSGSLDFESVKAMAEAVQGTFCFTILNDRNELYLVKGNNPLEMYECGGYYLYASTDSILKQVMKRFKIKKAGKVNLEEGTIIGKGAVYMKVGYIRVSTAEQNTARQEVLMEQLGVERMYIDKMSGKSADRPQLKSMLSFVRTGDTVIVESISRFARNTRDLLELVDTLTEKDVEFVSKKESIDTTTPAGKFMLTVFAAVAELERGYILDRQREGIAIAKSQGKYTGRKPVEVDEQLWDSLYALWSEGKITAVEFMGRMNMRKSTFYRRINAVER